MTLSVRSSQLAENDFQINPLGLDNDSFVSFHLFSRLCFRCRARSLQFDVTLHCHFHFHLFSRLCLRSRACLQVTQSLSSQQQLEAIEKVTNVKTDVRSVIGKSKTCV